MSVLKPAVMPFHLVTSLGGRTFLCLWRCHVERIAIKLWRAVRLVGANARYRLVQRCHGLETPPPLRSASH
jgi:hypothetical protein